VLADEVSNWSLAVDSSSEVDERWEIEGRVLCGGHFNNLCGRWIEFGQKLAGSSTVADVVQRVSPLHAGDERD
jgi:hypothetical protein